MITVKYTFEMLTAGRRLIRSRRRYKNTNQRVVKIDIPLFAKCANICNFSSLTECTKPVIFSGIQPTGIPHLGNYLGALQQWVRLQESVSPSTKLIFSVVDLHAITVRQDREHLRIWKTETLAALLAVGLDPSRSIMFFQSDVCYLQSFALPRVVGMLTSRRSQRTPS